MEVTVTTRHATIPDSLRDQTERLMRRFQTMHTRATSAVIRFEEESFEKSVEARLQMVGGPPIVAHASGPTFRAALDRAFDRLERQVKRRRGRWIQRRSVGAVRGVEPSDT